MQYEFAPLEGITGYIYRNAHHACFPSMDRYYTPFITPKKGKSFTTREWNDIAAEHNQNIAVVPQILTNQAEGFCKVAGMLKEQGYEEVNLNLGCPSATVTAKKKRRRVFSRSRRAGCVPGGNFCTQPAENLDQNENWRGKPG